MPFKSCPSCGHEHLELHGSQEGDFSEHRGLSPRQHPSPVLVECASCHWIGSTASRNAFA